MAVCWCDALRLLHGLFSQQGCVGFCVPETRLNSSTQHVANKPLFSSAPPSCVLLWWITAIQKRPQAGALFRYKLALVAALVTCYSTLICFVCPVSVTAKGGQYFLFVFHIKSPVVTGIYCEIFAGICCGEVPEAAAICPTRYSWGSVWSRSSLMVDFRPDWKFFFWPS